MVIAAGMTVNKYPLSSFENFGASVSIRKKGMSEFGLNTRIFQTQNVNRLRQVDVLSISGSHQKVFQFQMNLYYKRYTTLYNCKPYLLTEFGIHYSNFNSRNIMFKKSKLGNYFLPNILEGAGIEWPMKRIKNFGTNISFLLIMIG